MHMYSVDTYMPVCNTVMQQHIVDQYLKNVSMHPVMVMLPGTWKDMRPIKSIFSPVCG